MPRIRLTYPPDVTREGAEVIDVSEGRAQVLISKRRAVLVEDKPAAKPAAKPKAARKPRKAK